MALRQIRINDDPILRKKAREVDEVNDHIRMILDDMLDTLHNTENGAAIAAPQVGILKRLVVIDMGSGIFKLVNPKIVEQSDTQKCVEGCLSFPGRFGETERPKYVTVEALGEDGEKFTLRADGDMAKCLCHEIDHLDGILFVDKVTKWLNSH